MLTSCLISHKKFALLNKDFSRIFKGKNLGYKVENISHMEIILLKVKEQNFPLLFHRKPSPLFSIVHSSLNYP